MAKRLDSRYFDLQGHRGARGLLPENTLIGFAAAMEMGVTTLELDTAISQDGVVVVAHDRRLNSDITRDANGNWLCAATPTVRSLSLARIKTFDVGRIDPESSYHRRFPDQQGSDGVPMPTLAEVFDMVAQGSNTSIRFNIETKLSPLHPNEAAEPTEFVGALLTTIRAAKLIDRVTIQSFDWRTLRIARNLEPNVAVSYLSTEQSPGDTIKKQGESPWTDGVCFADHGSVPRMIAAAVHVHSTNTVGTIWSPHFADLSDSLIDAAHDLGISVLPWTLNEPQEIADAISMGVDGLITDYPDRARQVMAQLGLPLPG
ncbi:MAG: glycerophosphodiester phosphodiesterase [Burkholderiales bacterium]